MVPFLWYTFKVVMTSSASSTENELLTRGVAEIIDRRRLEQKLRRHRPLRVKHGIDPTSHQLHLGHALPLRQLRDWQRAGHRAVIIIGDFTARVGDPSGRDRQRPALNVDTIHRFAASYLKQVGRIVDVRRAEIHYNSEWFDHLASQDFLRLLSQFSVQQVLAHDTFRQRVTSQTPLSLLETVYPLLQGYDSVMVKADVEIGGLDQKFNLLAGRDIQTAYGQEPQDIILTPYLIGTDGKHKMSKSIGNTIAIEDSPAEMFGKVMSLPDKLIVHYFELATAASTDEVAAAKRSLRRHDLSRRDLKSRLASAIVSLYYGRSAAAQAAEEFTEVFRHKKIPRQMPTVTVRPGRHPLINLLVSHQLASSRSEARRLIEQGGVKINQHPITDWEATVVAEEGAVLQVGKRRFVKISLTE